jgi:hypothetical protein
MANARKLCATFLPLLILAQAVAADVNTDNVVIVLDGSGSMAERMQGTVKMDAAKQALAEVVKTLPESTHLGLLVFTKNARHRGWVYPLGPRNDAEFLKALRPIGPSGGTPLGAYIKIGADRLLEQREKQLGYGTYRLLVVTDGEASDGDLTDRFVPEVVARGIVIDAIGVDMKRDHTLATRVHSYRSASDPGSLKQALAEVLAEVPAGGAADSAAGEFELLEGLPHELALGIIGALARPDNTPIGEAGKAVRTQPSAQHRQAQPARSSAPPQRHRGKSAFGALGIMLAFGALVVIGVAMAVAKKLR